MEVESSRLPCAKPAGPSLFEVRPGADDVVQSLPRRQDLAHVTVPHQQVVGSQVPLAHRTLDQALGRLQRCSIGWLFCKTHAPPIIRASRLLVQGRGKHLHCSLLLPNLPPPHNPHHSQQMHVICGSQAQRENRVTMFPDSSLQSFFWKVQYWAG